VFEHVALAATQTVRAQMQEMMQPQIDPISGRMVPPVSPPEAVIQSSAAKLEAAMINQIMENLNPPPAEDSNASLLELQQRDLDIRQRALEAKEEETVLKLDLEERKLAAKERIDEERRQSNEDIAQLRANVSIERARLASESKGV
jgi:hypothetical protein